MPRSSAVRIVLMASASSLPPHIHPPIAHVPSAIRELTIAVPGIIVSSIGLVPLDGPRSPRASPGRSAASPPTWSDPRARRRRASRVRVRRVRPAATALLYAIARGLRRRLTSADHAREGQGAEKRRAPMMTPQTSHGLGSFAPPHAGYATSPAAPPATRAVDGSFCVI